MNSKQWVWKQSSKKPQLIDSTRSSDIGPVFDSIGILQINFQAIGPEVTIASLGIIVIIFVIYRRAYCLLLILKNWIIAFFDEFNSKLHILVLVIRFFKGAQLAGRLVKLIDVQTVVLDVFLLFKLEEFHICDYASVSVSFAFKSRMLKLWIHNKMAIVKPNMRPSWQMNQKSNIKQTQFWGG